MTVVHNLCVAPSRAKHMPYYSSPRAEHMEELTRLRLTSPVPNSQSPGRATMSDFSSFGRFMALHSTVFKIQRLDWTACHREASAPWIPIQSGGKQEVLIMMLQLSRT